MKSEVVSNEMTNAKSEVVSNEMTNAKSDSKIVFM